MYVSEYILKFPFLALYLPWDYYGWLGRVILILLIYEDWGFRGKKWQFLHQKRIIKILRNRLGIAFLIFQRLIWAPPLPSPHLPHHPFILTTSKLFQWIEILVEKHLAMTHGNKKTSVFVTKTSQVQELEK